MHPRRAPPLLYYPGVASLALPCELVFGAKLIMLPPHLTLANNQRLSKNSGKAPSIIAGASGYPNAPTRTCSRDLQVGFS